MWLLSAEIRAASCPEDLELSDAPDTSGHPGLGCSRRAPAHLGQPEWPTWVTEGSPRAPAWA